MRCILFLPENTVGVEAGQTTAVGENYVMPGFEKKKIVDYDDENLRASSSDEIAEQWAD